MPRFEKKSPILLHSMVAKTMSIKTTKEGIATTQKKPNGCFRPEPEAKFIPKYPDMNVRGANKTVTTANIIMKPSAKMN